LNCYGRISKKHTSKKAEEYILSIIFQGDYKTLKPQGYTYSKMFAANYICYHKDNVWLYRKGREVEIRDFYENSYLVLDYLIKCNFVIGNEFNRIALNRETKEMEEFDRFKHDSFYQIGKSREDMEAFYNRYHVTSLEQPTIDTLKDLYEQGVLTIIKEDEVNK